MVLAQIILLLIYLYSILSKFSKETFLRNVLIFFVSLYGIQLIAAILDPYHIYKIQFSTIFLFNLQIIFIIFGASFVAVPGVNKRRYALSQIFDIRINKYAIAFQTLFLLLAYYRYKKMNVYLLSASFSYEAREYYFSNFYSSYTELLLNQIVDAFIHISYFFAFGLLLFYTRKKGVKEWYIICSTIAIVVFNTLTSFGRGVIFQLLVIFILFFLLAKSFDVHVFRKKIVPWSFVIVGIVMVVLVITTMVRLNMKDSAGLGDELDEYFLRPFVTYFYIPICAFEYGSEHIFDDLVPMMGAADLAGPIDFLLTPLRYFDHKLFSPNNILGNKMDPIMYFPSGKGWNALFTGASNYYIDFSFLGFIIFPFIHGYLFSFLNYKCRKSGTWFVMFLFLFVSSFTHLTRSGIQSMDVVFLIIWIVIVKKLKVIT